MIQPRREVLEPSVSKRPAYRMSTELANKQSRWYCLVVVPGRLYVEWSQASAEVSPTSSRALLLTSSHFCKVTHTRLESRYIALSSTNGGHSSNVIVVLELSAQISFRIPDRVQPTLLWHFYAITNKAVLHRKQILILRQDVCSATQADHQRDGEITE